MTSRNHILTIYLLVALGAALGGGLRYLISTGLLEITGPAFPWGTLTVNTLGSLLIGYYAGLPTNRWYTGELAHPFITAGFCGGFTTFSIFSLEILRFIAGEFWLLAGVYLLASLLLWFTGVLLGYRLSHK